MLELRGVSYRYPGYARTVLEQIDLVIGDGEIVGLVGPNESGKSTLCLVASGLAPASIGGKLTGSLWIDGAPAADKSTHELSEHVVVGFQNPNTQRTGVAATVFEEIAVGPMNLGLSRKDVVQRTREAIDLLRLGEITTRDPNRLSGGQAQLVGIAGLLAMRPGHVILDEPTAQLDPAGTRLVGDALQALARSGSSLLIAEHKTDLLEEVCGRIVALDRGRIAFSGPAQDVFADDRLVDLGVEPPSRHRLTRALADASVDVAIVPGLLEAIG
jgi:energy-coupling factor transport system ATP-binding protein